MGPVNLMLNIPLMMTHLKGNRHLFSTQYYSKISLCLSQTFVEFLASPSLCFFSSVQCALCTGYSVCAMHIKLLRTASNVLLPCSTQVIVTSPDNFVCFFTLKWDSNKSDRSQTQNKTSIQSPLQLIRVPQVLVPFQCKKADKVVR